MDPKFQINFYHSVSQHKVFSSINELSRLVDVEKKDIYRFSRRFAFLM